MRKIILASASPRRRELLEQIGVSFEVCPSKGKEQTAETDPGAMVEELSREKCLEVFSGMDQDCIVIGADTVVALDGNGSMKTRASSLRIWRKIPLSLNGWMNLLSGTTRTRRSSSSTTSSAMTST